MSDDLLRGKVWKVGVDVNTDALLPTEVMYSSAWEQARHVLSTLRPGWAENEMKSGDFLLAGRNFGIGSSRPAPLAMNALGIKCLIADSINPLFLRNCVAFGLPAIECADVSEAFAEGDVAEVNFADGTVRNARSGTVLQGVVVPEALAKLMRNGGIFPLLESEGLIGPASKEDAGGGEG